MAGLGRREYEADSFRDAARGSEDLRGGVLRARQSCVEKINPFSEHRFF